jgi:hypothetical protein
MKSKLIMVIALVALVSLMIMPVMGAGTTTIDLVYSANADSTMEVSGSGSGVSIRWNTYNFNFDNLTNPTDVVWLTNAFKLPSQSGTFTGTYGTATMSGDFYFINGSFSGYQQQVWLHFNSFNKGSQTGIGYIELTGLPSGYFGANIQNVVGLTPIWATAATGGSAKGYGTYIVRDTVYGKTTFIVDGDVTDPILDVSIDKHGYSARTKIFSKNTAVYSEPSITPVNVPSFALLDKSLIFQTYLLGHYVNSSEYFTTRTQYNFTLDKNEINPGESVTASLTSSKPLLPFSELDAYTIGCGLKDLSGGSKITYAGNDPTWILSGGDWKQINDTSLNYDISYGTAFPSQVSLSGFESPGQYICEATAFSSDGYAPPKMYGTVNVTGLGSYRTVSFNVKDAQESGFIYGATVSVRRADGTWKNQTVTNKQVSVVVGDREYIGYQATAPGYDSPSLLYTQITADRTIDIDLQKQLSAPDGNATLSVFVKSASGSQWLNLADAVVKLSDGQVKNTPESGSVWFVVLSNSSYSVTVSKPGYQTLTRSILCGSTTCGGISMELVSLTVTTSPTLAPGASPTVDIRTDSQKDAAMMGKVRASGDDLIGLAIIAAMFGLVGLIGKSMK